MLLLRSTFAQIGHRSVWWAGLVVLGLVLPSTAAEVIHYQRLKSFASAANDGANPWNTVVQGADGGLYGVTLMGGSGNDDGVIFRMKLDGSDYGILHQFGSPRDGRNPLCDLTAASDGLLYGTTAGGGTNGAGTIFRIAPDGSGYTVIRSFNNAADGAEPNGLIEGSDGVLYGTTYHGPGNNYGGIAFAINKDGTGYRLLHRFGPFNSVDGLQSTAPLMEGSDHVLYGTTSTGGGGAVGSVFKVNRDGTGYQKLYGFGFGAAVINPFAGLVEGSDHALYGTGGGGAGGVFKLNKDGTGYQNLAGFNGDEPFAALVKGRDGALYSVTFRGGLGFGSYGRVFRMNEDGSGFQVLHDFGGTVGDGQGPRAALFLASDGAFYSTTLDGGDFGHGTVYRLLVNHTPVALCADAIVSADSNCVATASIDHGSFDPDGDPITLVQSPPGPYPLGTNLVTLTVTDINGDTNYCTASVIVLDTTPPQITCPSNITVEFATDAGATVSYSVSAVDSCDPSPVLASVPPSGSLFPIGATEVDSTATDASGNVASCAFTVTVLGARGVKQDVLAELVALRAGIICDPAAPEVCQDLDEAIGHLSASLNSVWWVDETHVQTRYGELVFDQENAAAMQLCHLIRLASGDIPDGLLEGFSARMQRVDRLLASISIEEALAAGVPQQRVQQAQKFLVQGDAEAAAGPCGNSILEYRQAWRHAIRPQLSIPRHLPNGHAQLELLSEPGAPATIQASTNLVDWVNLGTAKPGPDGILHYEDPQAGSYSVRYYRALSR
jgi:uncharacterized repeat protein (TIGR03803 family)